jgi:hypothetical protein
MGFPVLNGCTTIIGERPPRRVMSKIGRMQGVATTGLGPAEKGVDERVASTTLPMTTKSSAPVARSVDNQSFGMGCAIGLFGDLAVRSHTTARAWASSINRTKPMAHIRAPISKAQNFLGII